MVTKADAMSITSLLLITLVQSYMHSAMLGRVCLGLAGQCNITINFRHFIVVIYLLCNIIALHDVFPASHLFPRNFLLFSTCFAGIVSHSKTRPCQ